jgi:hypothetical protein
MMDYDDLLHVLSGHDVDDDPDDAEADFYGRYGFEWSDAERLIRDLIPLAMIAKSPITGAVYQGFGLNGLWLAKQELAGGGE